MEVNQKIPKKILMVDDEPDQIFSIIQGLTTITEHEFDFISAISGKECLQILNELENLPDLIILDIMMPEMSGWEVFNSIRENPKWTKIPIVFLTARVDRIAENAGIFLGDDYIEKPVEIEELKKRIWKILF
jgi:DNA-binding response OmpR family regulator